MNRFMRLLFGFFILIFAASSNGEQEWQIKSRGGHNCNPITTAEAQFFEWRETGLWNVDAERSLWVVCPIELDWIPLRFSGDRVQATPVQPSVVIANRSSEAVKVQSVTRESYAGQVSQAMNDEFEVAPGEFWYANTYGWGQIRPFNVLPGANCSITCLMPPGTGVTQILDFRWEDK